jgi:type IV pilus assembly protein PilC
MPLVGTVVQRNLISRWCHAVALAVEAGMDLSAAIKLADDATASPLLRADGQSLMAAVSAGQPLSSSPAGRILPLTVVTAMEASADRGDLAVTLRALSQMYQEQAELRIGAIQAILTPILLLLVGVVVGGLMIAMFAPLLSVLTML